MENHRKARVLICRSNPIAPDPRVEKVAATLSQAGYAVVILGWDRTGEHRPQEQVAGGQCFRLQIAARYGSGMGNFPSLLRWQWGLLRWMIQNRNDFDFIHACDFDTLLPALISKRLFGKKVIYDIFDFYADHLRATPSWIKRLLRAVDLRAISEVDGLILSDDVRLAQIDAGKIASHTVIYNTPQDLISHFENQVPPQTSLEMRLVYVGLLQVERGLLDILAILKDHPDWQLDLAGFGGDEQLILSQADQLPNVRWYGRIPYRQALTLTSSADVLLALYDPALPNHRYASPNKLFEAMMFAKPVIVAENTHIDDIVRRENCGLVVKYADRVGLESALKKLHGGGDLRSQLGANARRAYERQYNWIDMETRLLHLYAELE
jgi:glycosyltransferase involved in cell wall biosynthesis